MRWPCPSFPTLPMGGKIRLRFSLVKASPGHRRGQRVTVKGRSGGGQGARLQDYRLFGYHGPTLREECELMSIMVSNTLLHSSNPNLSQDTHFNL